MSFATYFNAFPASYWRRWSILESVVLRVELTGSARVDVYRSKATGARITVGGAPIASTEDGVPAVLEFEVELTRSRTAAGSGSTSPPTHRRRCINAGWYAPIPARDEPTSRSVSRLQPARRLR